MTSKLWRVLGATQPVFGVSDGSGEGAPLNDERIISITTTAGTTMAGLSTSSAEVEVNGYQGYMPEHDDLPMWVRFSSYGAYLMADLTGTTYDDIVHLFTGRVVAHDIDDNGNGKDGAPRLRTTLTGQDWVSFISQLDKGARADREEPDLWRVYRSLFTHVTIPSLGSLQSWGTKWPWVRFDDEEDPGRYKDLSTSDVLSRYMADVGVLVRQDRRGYPTAWSHDHLMYVAEQWRTFHPHPLQRSQVMAPVKWTRPATIPTALYWQQTGRPGDAVIRNYAYGHTGNLTTRAETVDMTHLWDTTWTSTASGFTDIMRSRFFRERGIDLTVESVTVDVLGLIQRGHAADLTQIGQLLTMNHGDPIVLGYDWPLVRGLHFAQQIKHKITRDQWHIELTLVPAQHVTGQRSTDIAGQTWETAYDPAVYWQSPQTAWKDTP